MTDRKAPKPNGHLVIEESGRHYVRFVGEFVPLAEPPKVPAHRRSPQFSTVTTRHVAEPRHSAY